MGVSTKRFGKYGWKVLEGLARFFDDFIEDYKSNIVLCSKMTCFFTEVISLIGFILPCVFCRVSFREFIHPDYDTCTNLEENLKNGTAKKLIYNLHNCVNNKLEKQELAQCSGNSTRQFEIKEKWRSHNKPFCAVHFITIVELEFWESFLIFLGYVMCDDIDPIYIKRFLESIGNMLSLVPAKQNTNLSVMYNQAILSIDLNTTGIWELGKYIYHFFGWNQQISFVEFQNICQTGIVVKCVK
jgi:hypothetical protein